MSLNREPLPLEASPRSVQQARRWTSGVLRAMGRANLCDSAELGVSELVTNALLHAHPPLSVRVRGTREHPRIEVADGSPEPPVPPDVAARLDPTILPDPAGEDPGEDPDEDPDEDPGEDPDFARALSTLGRGLDIVSMCARSWGADIRPEGKVVWFEPLDDSDCDDGRPTRGAIFTQIDDLTRGLAEEPLSAVMLQRVPLTLYAGFRQHFSELRRELRLLHLAHGSTYPLAAHLGPLLADFEARLRHADDGEPIEPSPFGVASGTRASDTRDLPMLVPRSTPQIVGQLIDLLDLADAFCRAERLLSLARTPLQRRFQHWFLIELVRQSEGQPPTPWLGDGAGQTAS